MGKQIIYSNIESHTANFSYFKVHKIATSVAIFNSRKKNGFTKKLSTLRECDNQ